MNPTQRESEVLHKLSDGYTTKEIAHQLFISTHTVESHKKNLINKMDVSNTMQLVVKAVRMGMVCLLLTIALISNAQYLVWENNYGGTDEETLTDMFETSDKGFLLVGNSRSDDLDADEISNCSSFSGTNNLIIKLTSSLGQVSWSKTIGGSSTDRANAGLELSDGYLIGGVTFSDDCDLVNEQNNTMLYKLNQNGILQWIFTYEKPSNTTGSYFEVIDIEKNINEDEFLVVTNEQDFNGRTESWIYTVNSMGIKTNSYEQVYLDINVLGVKKDSQGNYIFYGTSRSDACKNSSQFTSDIWIMKLSPSYQLLWEEVFGAEDFDLSIDDLEIKGDEISFLGRKFECFIATIANPETKSKGDNNKKNSQLPQGRFYARLNGAGELIFSRRHDISYSFPIDLASSEDGWLLTTSRSDLGDCVTDGCTDPRVICTIDTKQEPLYFLMKTDEDFFLECYDAFGGSEDEYPIRILEESDGNIVIAGHSESDNGDIENHYGNVFSEDYWMLEVEDFNFVDAYCKAGGYTFLEGGDGDSDISYFANFIDEFQFGAYKKVSDNNQGYANFRGDKIIVESGAQVSFQMFNSPIGGINSTSYPANQFAIWVDWNQDGAFESNEENIYPVSFGQSQGILSVPSGLEVGSQYQMRIGTFAPDVFDNSGSFQRLLAPAFEPDPCYQCFFGEYEDYTITIDLIPNLICKNEFQTLNCDYLVYPASYPQFPNNNDVSTYVNCTNQNKLLNGEEQFWTFYPDDASTEVTIDLLNLGNGDLDLIVLDRCNEKTSTIACSQNGAGSDESVTFAIDPSVDLYYVIVDAPDNSNNTEYSLRVDCDIVLNCFGGPANSDYGLFHMGIDQECVDLAYNETIRGFANEAQDYYVQLDGSGGSVPPNEAPAVTYLNAWIDLNDNGVYDQNNELWFSNEISMDNNSFGESSWTLPNVQPGNYKIMLQLYAFPTYDLDPLIDPCMVWFGGGLQKEYFLRVLDTTPQYCNSVGCTYCPASGGDIAYINQLLWGNASFFSGDNGGYLDNSTKFLTMQEGNHPEIIIDDAGNGCINEESFRLWVDANNDGDFDDTFERMYNDNNNGQITNNVFLNALQVGTYGLRIQYEGDNSSSGTTSPDPCENNFLGETEDYTLIVCEDINDCSIPLASYDITVDHNPTLEGVAVNYDIIYQQVSTLKSQGKTTQKLSGFIYEWTFPGGTPSTSTALEPYITYNTSGTYDVQLVLSDGVSSQTIIKTNYLVVYDRPVQLLLEDCPDTGDVINAQPGLYHAATSLNISGVTSDNSFIQLKAGNQINFLENFESNTGTTLEASIENCNN